MQPHLRALEFFSGIGGFHYALLEVQRDATVVAAFDVNELANLVYHHNFAARPCQKSVHTLTATQIDAFKANIWLLSPPCQPYTRRGHQLASSDNRASAFVELMALLPQLSHPPDYLIVENVVGFETSNTRTFLLELLQSSGYRIQECIISPSDLGIPYSRPRYFAMAKRSTFMVEIAGEPIRGCPVPQTIEIKQLKDYLIGCTHEEHHYLDDTTVRKHGLCLDIVTGNAPMECCNCFTKSYTQYIRGSGSVIATENADLLPIILSDFPCDCRESVLESSGLSLELMKLKLRYFSPREIANLHSFPKEFSFPLSLSLRQKYALLGNSLNVAVVAYLLQYLLS